MHSEVVITLHRIGNEHNRHTMAVYLPLRLAIETDAVTDLLRS